MKRILTKTDERRLKKFDDDFHASSLLFEIDEELSKELENDPEWAENCKDPDFPAEDIEYSMYEDRVKKAWGEKLKEFDPILYTKVCVHKFVRKCDVGTWAQNIDRTVCGIVYIPENYPELPDDEAEKSLIKVKVIVPVSNKPLMNAIVKDAVQSGAIKEEDAQKYEF